MTPSRCDDADASCSRPTGSENRTTEDKSSEDNAVTVRARYGMQVAMTDSKSKGQHHSTRAHPPRGGAAKPGISATPAWSRSSGCRRWLADSGRYSSSPPRWHVLMALMEVFCMQATEHNLEGVLVAPEKLIAATRAEFRANALAHLAALGAKATAMVIDFGNTAEIDTSGLGVLVLIQKRAKERGLPTRLRRTPERVRN